MKYITRKSQLIGGVQIPGSKSHTIRAIALASLAKGKSVIKRPLDSFDTKAAINAYTMLGAQIFQKKDCININGLGGKIKTPDDIINVLNSGTTLRIALGSAGLLTEGLAVFTGDDQIRSRPMGPLCRSLTDLGADVSSTRNNNQCPLVIGGTVKGGKTTIEAVTSQYLTSLLINTPLAKCDTHIHISLLNEVPYVNITLNWLKELGIKVEYNEDLSDFLVFGGQSYKNFEKIIPADFSSATFFIAAGAIGENNILVKGLDINDPQGDKDVIEYLKYMGANVSFEPSGIRVQAGDLLGRELDLNATPDALPMMAALGCLAHGNTILRNVPQARLKETDRIAVMAHELSKMGARIKELPDGLSIEHSELHGNEVSGHMDHRVVMALSIAGLASNGETIISDTEAVGVTYPNFFDSLKSLGADIGPV